MYRNAFQSSINVPMVLKRLTGESNARAEMARSSTEVRTALARLAAESNVRAEMVRPSIEVSGVLARLARESNARAEMARSSTEVRTALARLAAESNVRAEMVRPSIEVNGVLARLAQESNARAEMARQGQARWDDANAWLLRMGWPPPIHVPCILPRKLQESLDGRPEKEIQRRVRAVMLEYHDERTIRDEILAKWESKRFLNRRIHILRSAVEAHIRGDYALSVPALLPVVEGLVVECFGHRGHFNTSAYKKYLEQMMEHPSWASLSSLWRKFAVEFVLASFSHGKPRPNDLNRHAILHGADIKYATAETSLKALLLVDFIISAQFEVVGIEHSSVYHSPECARLRRSSRPRSNLGNEEIALALGRRPCLACCSRGLQTELRRAG